MIRTVGLAVAFFVAGCATPRPLPTDPSLDVFITFRDPAMCEQWSATERLFGSFVLIDPTLDGDWVRPGIVPPGLCDRLGPITVSEDDGSYTVTTASRGTLWGLKLLAIHQLFPQGGDPGGFTLEFDSPIDVVERIVRDLGFTAVAGKSVQMGPPDGYAYEIDLVRSPDESKHTLLSCGFS